MSKITVKIRVSDKPFKGAEIGDRYMLNNGTFAEYRGCTKGKDRDKLHLLRIGSDEYWYKSDGTLRYDHECMQFMHIKCHIKNAKIEDVI